MSAGCGVREIPHGNIICETLKNIFIFSGGRSTLLKFDLHAIFVNMFSCILVCLFCRRNRWTHRCDFHLYKINYMGGEGKKMTGVLFIHSFYVVNPVAAGAKKQ